MFSSCREDFWGEFRRTGAPQNTRVQGQEGSSPVWCGADMGAPGEALRGKGLARPRGAGLEIEPASLPTRELRQHREPEEVQSLFHSLGPRFPNRKGLTVRDQGKGIGQVGARAQGPRSGPEQPGPGCMSATRTRGSGKDLERTLLRLAARAARAGRGAQPSTPANGRQGRRGGGAGASL